MSTTEELLWAYGFLQNLALLLVLLSRGRARLFPVFTGLIAFGTLRTIVLFLVYKEVGRHHGYALIYWWAAAIDLLLQAAVVYEIAKNTLYRSSEWILGTKARFLRFASAAPVVGLLLSLTMTPAARNGLDAWDARANLFITATMCVMVSAVMTVSRQIGVGWNRLVLRYGAGLVVWSLASFVTGSLHAYWRTINDFSVLENLSNIVYLLVTLYWIVIFWGSDSGRLNSERELSGEYRNRLMQVARRTGSDRSEI